MRVAVAVGVSLPVAVGVAVGVGKTSRPGLASECLRPRRSTAFQSHRRSPAAGRAYCRRDVGQDRKARRNSNRQFSWTGEGSVAVAGPHFGVGKAAATREREVGKAVAVKVSDRQAVGVFVERGLNPSAEVARAIAQEHPYAASKLWPLNSDSTTMSGWPSSLTSAIATACGKAGADNVFGDWNVPLPLPR